MDQGKTGWQRHDLSEGPAQGPPLLNESSGRASGTFFAQGCEVAGVLSVDNSIALDGEFQGAIACEGTVTILAEAAVQADIRARTVIIHGAVVGNVEASREVILGPTARVHGDLETVSLVIERGAFVVGATRMRAPLPARPSLPASEAVVASASGSAQV